MTEVLRTQRGYQILKLESRTETRIRSFDDARGDISNRVGGREIDRRAHEVPGAASQPGHDHVAQRRAEEGVRTGTAERRKVLAG